MTELPSLALIERARGHGDRRAVIDSDGAHSYSRLLDASAGVATSLLDGREDLTEARVAFMVPPGFDHVATQWGIWRAGGIAVPLALGHPPPELLHVIRDSGSEAVVCHPAFDDRLRPIAAELGPRLLSTEAGEPGDERGLPAIDPSRRAMILYTSGTTGRPKGAVTTHRNIAAQVKSLVDAWAWSESDHILHVLPLHHVHGIVNVLSCALWAGATCEFLQEFDAERVWDCLGRGDLTLFMAVPTIYHRLIAAWEAAPADRRDRMRRTSRSLRLMVSGSAALPMTTLDRWREITGHVLLERYGMTEIGMALSNPLVGNRVPGTVGTPLPGIELRLVGDRGEAVAVSEPGEIEVKGPGVFAEYWRRPEATREAFREGWFRTGDQAVVEDGRYRILGRSSVDIIKSGGEKVSALEIEEALRDHPAIADCAVVGVEDPEWGQRVAAAVELAGDRELGLEELREWARARLAPAKLPRDLLAVDRLPRNAMGKVSKPDVSALFRSRSAPLNR